MRNVTGSLAVYTKRYSLLTHCSTVQRHNDVTHVSQSFEVDLVVLHLVLEPVVAAARDVERLLDGAQLLQCVVASLSTGARQPQRHVTSARASTHSTVVTSHQ